ncbi:hypothetical protein [Streptomyces vastus]|uniref:hypothetical protein n=1 Tax=Streptomyces vastus TaxID=285451 RepID=UPI0031D71318
MAQLLAAGTWRRLDRRPRLWTTTTRSNVRRPQLQILSLTLVRLLEAADDTLRDEIAGTLRECADTVLERAQVLPSRCGHRQPQPYYTPVLALRDADDATADALADELGLPGRLLTHWKLTPRADTPLEDAADALACITALAAPAADAAAAVAAAVRHRLTAPAVLDLVAEEAEAAAAAARLAPSSGADPTGSGPPPWEPALAALDTLAATDAALRPAALLLRARAPEGTGDCDTARRLVTACLEASPGPLPAVRDAAEYELCAGNWTRAHERPPPSPRRSCRPSKTS